MNLAAVRAAHEAINVNHRLVYFAPEGAEEYGPLGASGRGAYFSVRSAPMGPISDEMIIATFYNFAPRAVRSAEVQAVWASTTPAALQAARFRVVQRVLDRIGFHPSASELAEARSLIDPVVAGLDLAGKPLAAANAIVALPDDPRVALWQQLTVVREWRGDAHIAVLQFHQIGPCDCNVLQTGTGRFPLALAQASRQWTEAEWDAAVTRLAARGWATADGALTAAGIAAREEIIEVDTDRLCAPIWAPIGAQGAERLAAWLDPLNDTLRAAGAFPF